MIFAVLLPDLPPTVTVIFTTIRPLAHTSKPLGNICTYTPTQIFTFCMVYNGNLHVPAKLRLDRLNGVGDVAIFFIPNMAAVRHCEFLKNANFYFLHGLR